MTLTFLTNPVLFPIIFNFGLFCYTFVLSLFTPKANYHNLLLVKKMFLLLTKPILYLLSFSVIVQIILLYNPSILVEYTPTAMPFFASDYVYQIFLVLITIVGLYFFWLLVASCAYTRQNVRYLLELPNLFLLLLMCLQLFIIATDLIIFILCLELITFLVLIFLNFSFFADNTVNSLESAVKYFVFNGFSMSFLWFAVAGYYSIFNSLTFDAISNLGLFFPELLVLIDTPLLGLHFIFFFAYCIKLGLGPVHFWLPDVYEGAETIMTALLVIIIGPILFLKFILLTKNILIVSQSDVLNMFFMIIGSLSIGVGTLGAFAQKKIKRFLAFAGLTHFGFMFVCLSQGHSAVFSLFGTLFYLFIYIVMNIVFFSLLILQQRYTRRPVLYFSSFKSLLYGKHLLLYLSLGALFSFAGLPPFAGFFSKAAVLYVLLENQAFSLIVFLLVTVLVNVYLYLRFIKTSLFETTTAIKYLRLPERKHYHVVINSSLTKKSESTTQEQLILLLLTVLVMFLGMMILFLPSFAGLLLDFSLSVLCL